MTRKQRRIYFLAAALILLAAASALVLTALEEDLQFFYSPSDLQTEQIAEGRNFRLGGLVEEGSIEKIDDGLTVRFAVTDTAESVSVVYTGILPDLFREGQGVIVKGKLNAQGDFVAHEVLAKHDENYMPPEVADALKESGTWQHGGSEEEATGYEAEQ